MMMVPVLLAPALVAMTVIEPTGRFDIGTQLQLPDAATLVVHTAIPLALARRPIARERPSPRSWGALGSSTRCLRPVDC